MLPTSETEMYEYRTSKRHCRSEKTVTIIVLGVWVCPHFEPDFLDSASSHWSCDGRVSIEPLLHIIQYLHTHCSVSVLLRTACCAVVRPVLSWRCCCQGERTDTHLVSATDNQTRDDFKSYNLFCFVITSRLTNCFVS